ncbi:MAG: TetR/AcrR family transcriptional regulator, partial [Myxococcota bacterium]
MPLPRFHKLCPNKRTELLDAAAAELAEKGFDGASIASVVERTGASKSAVYYYFEDKEDLFETVLENSIEQAMATVGEYNEAALEADFWPTFRKKKLSILRHFAGRPVDQALWRLAMTARSGDHPHPGCVGALHQRMHDKWKAIFAIGRRAGAIRDDLPEDMAVELVLAADGIMQRHFIQHADFEDAFLTQYVDQTV